MADEKKSWAYPRPGSRGWVCFVAGLALMLGFSSQASGDQVGPVTTYHNDNQRTGWYPFEKNLMPANVTPATFGLLHAVPLDDQVDTQPLIVAGQNIAGHGIHNVAYVATEGNTVYAIDALSGTILTSVNLGTPVHLPLECNNNGPNVGISGTPTIDIRTQTLYVLAYTQPAGAALPTYQLHALNLSSLADKAGSPVTVTASHPLASGETLSFTAKYQRQRAALLQSNGNIYAAFAGFCDSNADKSRGWVLGWNAQSLAPLPHNELTNTLSSPASSYYLASVWMSGYGVAADATDGNLFFVTGNSDPVRNTYDGSKAIQESVVKMNPDLSSVMDLFTPSNQFRLDQGDSDYSSGGVMILPDQPGPVSRLAVAAGKDGRMFILNRGNLGGFHTPDRPAFVPIGDCWCGPSYFQGVDGIGRVVSSGGNQVKTWKVNTALTPALTLEASSTGLASGQDGGFFTTISSNGQTNPIIWALSHPSGSGKQVTLYAFNGIAAGASLPLLYSSVAGTWPNDGGNANLVPTVALGHVYAATYKRLAIFGRKTSNPEPAQLPRRLEGAKPEDSTAIAPPPPRPEGSVFRGTIQKVEGNNLEIKLRDGEILRVDLSEAKKIQSTITPTVGSQVMVNGKLNPQGVMEAHIMQRAKGPAHWGPDIRE